MISLIMTAGTMGSCQKQEAAVNNDVLSHLVFTSEKPAFNDETRTEWTGETIQWSAGDRIAIAYTVDGKWQNASGDASGDAKLYKSELLSEAAETAQFNVSTSFKGTTEGGHVFYGVYPAPSETGFAEAPVATLTIPAIQTPGVSSFDSGADLMIAVSGEYDSRPEDGETVSLLWTRLVAHADITLKNLAGVTAGETVTGIKLTAQDGANLVGTQKVDIMTGEVTNQDDNSNVIEFNGGNLSIDGEGNLEFWACFLPETLTSLMVEVETDQATYTREITGIEKTFKQNARNILTIRMDDASRTAKEEEESWVMMTSGDELTEGTYVLVVKNTNSKNYTAALDNSNGSSKAPALNTSVKVTGNSLTGVGPSVQFDMTVVSGGYKFAVAGQTQNYLYTTNTNNGVRIGTGANNVWTLTPDTDNPDAYTFKCVGTNRYLGVYEGNPDWRCYTSINDNIKERNSEIYLYKKSSGTAVPDTTPSINVEESLTLSADGSEGVIEVTYRNLTDLSVSVYSDAACSAVCDWFVAEWTADGISYAAEANDAGERTAYVRISAYDCEENEFAKIITVTQDAYVETVFESGQYWIMDGNGHVVVPIDQSKSYGYWYLTDAVADGDTYVSYAANAFTFEEAEGGYTIQDSYGRYHYMTTYNSFSLSESVSSEGHYVWTVTPSENGTYAITNLGTGKTVQFSSYGNYAPYTNVTGALPVLVKAENPLPEGDDPSEGDESLINQVWLELPTGLSGDRYVMNTCYSGEQRNYSHLYDTKYMVSLWTAYPLNSGHMGSISRPKGWSYNPDIDSKYQADIVSNSYIGSTYSRGHMIPNGSRNGIRDMQLQTFYATNSVPQRQDRFNGSIWNSLEQAIQAQAADEEIYVVTGVAFSKVGESKTVSYVKDNSSRDCAIPNYFYKVVLKVRKSGTTVTSASTVGFWFEHKDYEGNAYANYAVSVDQIEEWTGFDFFVNLPDGVEESAEQNSSWSKFSAF